jgi:hypothetical protein
MVSGLALTTANEDDVALETNKYLSLIGSLSYLAVGTRPDIAFTVNYLARFSAKPLAIHWTALKHLLRYVLGTRGNGLFFKSGDPNDGIDAYCDANWGGECSRSTHGYVIFLFGCPVAWASRRQSCVATSTCHAEYMSLGTTARELVWVIQLVEEMLGIKFKGKMMCDNTAAVKVAKDLHMTKRSHHVAREFHYVNELIYDGIVEVLWIDGRNQRADIMTKPLGHILFNFFKPLLCMTG